MLVFLVLPLASIVVFSFWRTESYVMIAEWNLDNYETLFGEATYLTFLLALGADGARGLADLPDLRLALAYLIAKHGGRYRLVLVLLTAAPFLTGIVLRGHRACSRSSGPIGAAQHGAHDLRPEADPGLDVHQCRERDRPDLSLDSVHGWSRSICRCSTSTSSSWRSPRSTAPRRCARSVDVTWPLNWIGTAIGIVLVFIPTLAASVTPHFLGGPNGALYGNILEHQFDATGTWALGSAMGVVLFLVSLLVDRADLEDRQSAPRRLHRRLGR